MDKIDSDVMNYSWNKDFFEKKITLFTNIQMGAVGAALMLMMMDLSKLYLLAPLVVGLILASWYKHHIANVCEEVKNCSISFSPKSILLSVPTQELESRITFREIEEITVHKEHFIEIITLYLKEDEEKVELKAIQNAEQLVNKLNQAISETQNIA